MTEILFMQRALELARKGSGWVNPNPLVGAVLEKNGQILSEGYHAVYGGIHAERMALEACSEPPSGATLYVTLEPCCHTGKTPPCTDAIIASGIRKVVVGSRDPDPRVDGGGIAQLRKAGIEVVEGCLEEACQELNRIFFHYVTQGTPFVLLKYAMTSDGKVATKTGAARWISGEVARRDVHRLRGRYASIMVGIQTVLSDNPLLNCRLEGERDPLRIVCDTTLRIPQDSALVSSACDIPLLIATKSTNRAKIEALEKRGCEVFREPSDGNHIDLRSLMAFLGSRGIDSVLLEGGPTLHAACLEAGVVQAVRYYIAPKLFGGVAAPSPVGGLGVSSPAEAFLLDKVKVEHYGEDICIHGEVIPTNREQDWASDLQGVSDETQSQNGNGHEH